LRNPLEHRRLDASAHRRAVDFDDYGLLFAASAAPQKQACRAGDIRMTEAERLSRQLV